jgi:hypothetical protein
MPRRLETSRGLTQSLSSLVGAILDRLAQTIRTQTVLISGRKQWYVRQVGAPTGRTRSAGRSFIRRSAVKIPGAV